MNQDEYDLNVMIEKRLFARDTCPINHVHDCRDGGALPGLICLESKLPPTRRFTLSDELGMLVVKAMRERGCGVVINGGANSLEWYVSFGPALCGHATNPRFPMAVCLAVKEALTKEKH